MDFSELTQVHPTEKGRRHRTFHLNRIVMKLRSLIEDLYRLLTTPFIEAGKAFAKGDFKTRCSFFLMGSGSFLRGQRVKGLIYFLAQVLYIAYILFFGIRYLKDIGTLGTVTQNKVFDAEEGIYIYTAGDNSMKILLFSVLTVVITIAFISIYFLNIRSAYLAQRRTQEGKTLLSFREDVRSLFDKRYHVTLLTLPILLIAAFTLLPLVFMVLIAFTNFDKTHQPPGNLFTWVGLENFKNMFGGNVSLGHTLLNLFVWTLIWAIFSTFTNYIFGMILALMINKKGIRFKRFWRTIFILTIAVPQFVSLMLMSQLLADEGAVNVLLRELGLQAVPFLTDGLLAKITVIVVNMWVGIPYTMLITSGILMNIPADMYESAKIDGAGPVKTFFKITFPYMLFVTTPYLITQFVNNINNFNVIYLLTKGGPLTLEYYKAGKTDLLVTWLYKQTVEEQNYNLAGVIGVIVFIITAAFSLMIYNSSASSKKEEEFQ